MPEVIISDYFYGDEADSFTYFRIPRQLISDERFKGVSTDAKLRYGMLPDRVSVSVNNQMDLICRAVGFMVSPRGGPRLPQPRRICRDKSCAPR